MKLSLKIIGLALTFCFYSPLYSAPTQQSASRSPLFQSFQALEVRLEAPFEELWRLVESIQARDDLEPFEKDALIKDTFVKGHLSYLDPNNRKIVLELKIRARGNTSLNRRTECSFPKLKLKIRSVEGSLFESAESLGLATHCGELQEGQFTPDGRAAHEEGAKREAFLYEMIDRFGVPSPKARLTNITYVEQGNQQEYKRAAFFLEDFDDMAKRLQSKAIEDEEWAWRGVPAEEAIERNDASEHMSAEDLARVYFVEALAGNTDWRIEYKYEKWARLHSVLWNVQVLRRPDGSEIPIPYDYDIASIVTGKKPVEINSSYKKEDLSSFLKVYYPIQRTRNIFEKKVLESTRNLFIEKKDEIISSLNNSQLNTYSKKLMRDYIDSFFLSIGEEFYTPALNGDGIQPYFDEALTQLIECHDEFSGPTGGFPVKILRETPRAYQVEALDVKETYLECGFEDKMIFWIKKPATITTAYP